MGHQKDKLSEYLDGALGAGESRALEEHLSSCADCRAELEGLREVSKLVAGLPKEPLPVGFMERLQRRREGAGVETAGGWTGFHWRAAAFAAAGVVALLIGYREVGFRSAAVSSTESLDAAPALTEGDVAERKYWRKDVHAKGQPLLNVNEASPASDMDGAAQSAASGFAGGAGVAALRASAAVRGGAAGVLVAPAIPAPQKTLGSNEAIQDFLAQDRDKMGIREILPQHQAAMPEPAGEEEGFPQRPMPKAEAMQYLRNMTSQISKLNADRANKVNPSVAVTDTRKPRLLADSGASRPLTEAAAPMAAAADSFLLARGAAGAKVAQAKVEADMTISHKEIPAKKDVPAIPRYQEEAPAGAQWTRTWVGAASGLTRGVSAAKDAAQWESLWFRLGLEGSPPQVDFKEDMVVVVVGEEGQSVGIESLRPQGPNLWISYRAKMDKGAEAGKLPFHAVVVPRSDLDLSVQQSR